MSPITKVIVVVPDVPRPRVRAFAMLALQTWVGIQPLWAVTASVLHISAGAPALIYGCVAPAAGIATFAYRRGVHGGVTAFGLATSAMLMSPAVAGHLLSLQQVTETSTPHRFIVSSALLTLWGSMRSILVADAVGRRLRAARARFIKDVAAASSQRSSRWTS